MQNVLLYRNSLQVFVWSIRCQTMLNRAFYDHIFIMQLPAPLSQRHALWAMSPFHYSAKPCDMSPQESRCGFMYLSIVLVERPLYH